MKGSCVVNAERLRNFYIQLNRESTSGGVELILRLAELPIHGDWNACIEASVRVAGMKPLPDVLILPELFSIGFALGSIPANTLSLDELGELPLSMAASENGIWIVGGTFPVRTDRGIVNMLPVYDRNGKLVHTTEKTHLFRNLGEDTVFTPGQPAGVFQLDGVTAGASVCYDLRFPELFRRHSLAGAEIFIIPAHWPAARIGLFKSLLQVRAGEAQIFAAGCNIGGEHLGELYCGGGGVADPSGNLLEGRRLNEHISDYDLDFLDIQRVRKSINCLEDRRPEVYGGWE